MLMHGVAGWTLNSAPAPVDGFAGGIAMTSASRLSDINRAIDLYADQ